MKKARGQQRQVELFGALQGENPTPPPAAPGSAAPPVLDAAREVPSVPGPQAAAPRVLSVLELTRQIKGVLERGFAKVMVRGEVSGFRGANPRGHLYFSLKDEGATIDTRIWASMAQRLKFKLKDGLAVVVEGHVDVYEPSGRYSLIVHRIEPEGVGALALAFEQLKQKLMDEGLFGDRRVRPQRPIPFLPRRIGVVTSISGAALKDFLRVLHARHPRLPVLVCDARVQGEGAADEVARAIGWLERTDVDVIVVTRGGGSVEDLWTFNEEKVARAIFGCRVPVVSAIGHEIDTTIADFVADYRAPTPSAAAERLAPVLSELELSLATHQSRLRKAVERSVLERRGQLSRLSRGLADPRRRLSHARLGLNAQADGLARAQRTRLRAAQDELKGLTERLARNQPQARLARGRGALAASKEQLVAAMRLAHRREARRLELAREALAHANPRTLLASERGRLAGLAGSLHAMSPLAVMGRGYALVFKGADLVRSAEGLREGDEVRMRLAHRRIEDLSEADEIFARVMAAKRGTVRRG